MKKTSKSIVIIVLTIGFILLYSYDPLEQEKELPGWGTIVLLAVLTFTFFNKNKTLDAIIRIGVFMLFLYSILYYFI